MSGHPIFGGGKDFDFFDEIGKVLSQMKCNNSECSSNLTPTSHMYFVTCDASGVTFKVNDKVCCSAFKNELELKVDSIYQKYK